MVVKLVVVKAVEWVVVVLAAAKRVVVDWAVVKSEVAI